LQRARSISQGDSGLYRAGATLETIANRQPEAVAELKLALEKGLPASDVDTDPEFATLRNRSDYQALIKEHSRKK
jgi:hypothetical protein